MNTIILEQLSQEEVAEKIGISRQAYAKWEKGETPDVERYQKLAELYGVTILIIILSDSKRKIKIELY